MHILTHADTGNPRGSFVEFTTPAEVVAAVSRDGSVRIITQGGVLCPCNIPCISTHCIRGINFTLCQISVPEKVAQWLKRATAFAKQSQIGFLIHDNLVGPRNLGLDSTAIAINSMKILPVPVLNAAVGFHLLAHKPV